MRKIVIRDPDGVAADALTLEPIQKDGSVLVRILTGGWAGIECVARDSR